MRRGVLAGGVRLTRGITLVVSVPCCAARRLGEAADQLVIVHSGRADERLTAPPRVPGLPTRPSSG
jgi:hypothetical protein